MALRQIEIPSLGRSLSNLMGAPSSADPMTHEAGLDAYDRLGGNCLHLHGEGGETHSRRSTGEWRRCHHFRPELFLCTQICHAGWDDTARRPINRFTPEAVREDIAEDLDLIGTDYLDLVYLDDHPALPFEPVIAAIGSEIAGGRVRAMGVRNWSSERIRAASAYATGAAGFGISVLVTTELALPSATGSLWPEYLPFDAAMRRVVQEMRLAVFAHAGDVTLGQCLFGDADTTASMRPEWVRRWDSPINRTLVQQVRHIAAAREVTPREMNLAWLLNQEFPVIGIVALPALLTDLSTHYQRASQLRLNDSELRSLKG